MRSLQSAARTSSRENFPRRGPQSSTHSHHLHFWYILNVIKKSSGLRKTLFFYDQYPYFFPSTWRKKKTKKTKHHFKNVEEAPPVDTMCFPLLWLSRCYKHGGRRASPLTGFHCSSRAGCHNTFTAPAQVSFLCKILLFECFPILRNICMPRLKASSSSSFFYSSTSFFILLSTAAAVLPASLSDIRTVCNLLTFYLWLFKEMCHNAETYLCPVRQDMQEKLWKTDFLAVYWDITFSSNAIAPSGTHAIVIFFLCLCLSWKLLAGPKTHFGFCCQLSK